MESTQIMGMVIASVAVIGGMAISVFVLKITVPPYYQEKLLMLENQSKERLALIEKGIDPAILYKREKKVSQEPLFWGLLLAGIGFGAFYGSAVWHSFIWASENAVVNSSACFGGGIGLIIYHLIRRMSSGKKAG